MEIDQLVRDYIKEIFSSVDDSVTKKLSMVPNIPEESLDIEFITHLSNYSAPTAISKDWAVSISSHFIGSIRHYRRYEIADIGIIFVFKQNHEIQKRKLVLLQSKRLYPLDHNVVELEDFDYQLGLGMHIKDEDTSTPIFTPLKFEFTKESKYGAVQKDSRQCEAIKGHLNDTDIPVYYMLYSPVILPWSVDYPIPASGLDLPKREFGTRIVDSEALHKKLARAPQVSPRPLDLANDPGAIDLKIGWELADFIDEVVICKQGHQFSRDKFDGIRRLFRRKSGPIFCTIEITIEHSTDTGKEFGR